MDGDTTVPLVWVFVLGGALAASLMSAFTWWLRNEWQRNWNEHTDMKLSAKKAHSELDNRIAVHHAKIDQHLARIHNRMDWVITHGGIPRFPAEDEQKRESN